MDDETTAGDDGPRLPRPGFLERATPYLRSVGDALDRDPDLRQTRDALVREARARLATGADGLVRRADDALARATAVEGTVIDADAATAPDAGSTAAPTSATEHDPDTRFRSSTPPASTPGGTRRPHWNRGRLSRMALAAAREAARPDRTPSWPPRGLRRLGVALALVIITTTVLVRRRRR